jgi:uncharacterized protein (DUF58 family)
MAVPVAELHHKAEALAASLPPLMVAADRVAATVSQGVHGRRRVGQGETFWQYRRYQWGDPVRDIDWRRSAKSDPIYVRQNEWEAAQSVWLWSDRSESMHYRSNRRLPEKSERADLLTLALASLLLRGGEHIAALGHSMSPGAGKMALHLMAQTMAADDRGGEATSLPPFAPLPRFARVVLVSDFFEPLDAVNRTMGRLADRGVGGHLLQVIDPAEESLPFGGRARFEGTENEGNALIGRVESVRRDYGKIFEEHREGLKALAHTAGWTFATHVTDRPPQAALLGLYLAVSSPREY